MLANVADIAQRSLRSVAHRRSVLLKAVGYRVVSVVVTVVVAFALLGDLPAAVDVGVVVTALSQG